MNLKFSNISEREFLTKYLEFTNLLYPEDRRLIPTEIALITEFALLPDDKFYYQRFGSLAKKKVAEAASLNGWKLNKLNINNKLYDIIKKGFLKRDEDRVIQMPKHLYQALQEFRTKKQYTITVHYSNGV